MLETCPHCGRQYDVVRARHWRHDWEDHAHEHRECRQARLREQAPAYAEKYGKALPSQPCGTCGQPVLARDTDYFYKLDYGRHYRRGPDGNFLRRTVYCSERCADHAAYLARKAKRVRPTPPCAHCGKIYQAQRSTSRYCSDRCRAAAHRGRQPS